MSQNGKGSTRRVSTKQERKNFDDNYDKIFSKNKKSQNATDAMINEIVDAKKFRKMKPAKFIEYLISRYQNIENGRMSELYDYFLWHAITKDTNSYIKELFDLMPIQKTTFNYIIGLLYISKTNDPENTNRNDFITRIKTWLDTQTQEDSNDMLSKISKFI